MENSTTEYCNCVQPLWNWGIGNTRYCDGCTKTIKRCICEKPEIGDDWECQKCKGRYLVTAPRSICECAASEVIENVCQTCHGVVASKSDMVNHPKHYGGADDPYEAIKVIEAWKLGFNLGSAVKYIRRLGMKNDEIEELEKARWYIDREITNRKRAQNEKKTLP